MAYTNTQANETPKQDYHEESIAYLEENERIVYYKILEMETMIRDLIRENAEMKKKVNKRFNTLL